MEPAGAGRSLQRRPGLSVLGADAALAISLQAIVARSSP
jgi:hypothetical protein